MKTLWRKMKVKRMGTGVSVDVTRIVRATTRLLLIEALREETGFLACREVINVIFPAETRQYCSRSKEG